MRSKEGATRLNSPRARRQRYDDQVKVDAEGKLQRHRLFDVRSLMLQRGMQLPSRRRSLDIPLRVRAIQDPHHHGRVPG